MRRLLGHYISFWTRGMTREFSAWQPITFFSFNSREKKLCDIYRLLSLIGLDNGQLDNDLVIIGIYTCSVIKNLF